MAAGSWPQPGFTPGRTPTAWRWAGKLGFEKGLQTDRERIDDFLVKTTSVCGRELVSGAGEILIDVGSGSGSWSPQR